MQQRFGTGGGAGVGAGGGPEGTVGVEPRMATAARGVVMRRKVDVEKKCGVPFPNGSFCGRSLTCSDHSIAAKRSVLGRSQPFDVLLEAYRRNVDVDSQCGVLQPNYRLCTRSLTCKTHSICDKRRVLGRSQPYDVLLEAKLGGRQSGQGG